jgi:hypothetical protein
MRWSTSYRLGRPGVNVKFKPADRSIDPGGEETVPIIFQDGYKLCTKVRVQVGWDVNDAVELFLVLCWVPYVNVVSWW